jgi:hypothetical protein
LIELTTNSTILWVVIGVLFTIASISIFFAIKFALIILRTQDAIEDSLDVLDSNYDSISKVIATPLFHDSPEIRRVLVDIHAARTSILGVASALTEIDSPEELKDEDT